MSRIISAALLGALLVQDAGDAASEKARLHDELAASAEGIGDQLIKLKAWDEARAFLEMVRAKSDARAEALDKLIAKTEKQTSGLKWDAKPSELIKAFGAERAKKFFAYAKAWKEKDAEASRWTEAEAEILDDLLDYVKAYARLTQIRTHYELPKTRFDWKLSVPAVWHAKYKLANPKHSQELEGHEGYTKEGQVTSKGSITSPDESVSDMMEGLVHTPFNRNYILHPGLERTGLGQAKGQFTTGVVDVKSALGSIEYFNPILSIPRDKAINVPPRGYDDRTRIVEGKSMKDLGYPISLVFFDPTLRPKDVKVDLTERMKSVEHYVSTPENLAFKNTTPYCKSTILLVSREPLKPETEYRVSIRFDAKGESRTVEWSFKTGR